MTFDLFGFDFGTIKGFWGFWICQVLLNPEDEIFQSLFAIYYEEGTVFVDLFFTPLLEFDIIKK